MKKTGWMPSNTTPKRRGLYERDWTDTGILPVEDRRIHMDLWELVPNKRDILYPGVWYVEPGWNDASRQNLPWRGLDLGDCLSIVVPTGRRKPILRVLKGMK